MSSADPLTTQLLAAYQSFTTNIGSRDPTSDEAATWERLEGTILIASKQGVLRADQACVAQVVAQNVYTFIQSMKKLDEAASLDLDVMTKALGDITVSNARGKDRLVHQEAYLPGFRLDSSDSCRGRRQRHASPCSPSSSRVPPCSSRSSPPDTPLLAAQLPPEPTDHLRLWFLDNISNPYPTPQEKQYLSEQTGIVRTKIDSDLTNWRRRAGWTDIKDRWCDRDKKKMRELIEGYEMGRETRAEVINAIERMKGYLMKEKENSVGSWIEHVSDVCPSLHLLVHWRSTPVTPLYRFPSALIDLRRIHTRREHH
jgi:hypothetical protein